MMKPQTDTGVNDVAALVTILAALVKSAGNEAEALVLYRRALSIFEQALGSLRSQGRDVLGELRASWTLEVRRDLAYQDSVS
jgi:hypothetical protein